MGYQPSNDDLGDLWADELLINGVPNHFSELLGDPILVYHEEQSVKVHIDLHRFDPIDEIEFYTLVTSGVASLPMNTPAELQNPELYRYAELLLHLPADWPMEWEELKRAENFWPIRALRLAAKIPHLDETWIWSGHTIAAADNLDPYSGDTKFCASIICPSFLLPKDMRSLNLADGRSVDFLTLAFIYREEYEYCLEHDSTAFFDRVRESGLSMIDFFVLNKNRPNVC